MTQAGLSELQAKIYLYLILHGQRTASEIATGIEENRTTVYSALEKLDKLGIIAQKNKGKISAYAPSHPSILESIAEKRLRSVARQARNLESNLPSLINFYNEHQNKPGVKTFYGMEGRQMIWNKVLATKKPYYFVRSRHDKITSPEMLENFRSERVELGIKAEDIAQAGYVRNSNQEVLKKYLLDRTLIPPEEYDSPVEIDIFGDNVAFINFSKNGMSTLIESPEIADAMRQVFLFAKKYIRKSTDQDELDKK